ncbi:FecR domain-containing protein [soil metagenome]
MMLAIALQAAAIGAPVPARPETIVYTVRKRDTLERLSRSFLVPQRTWQSLLPLARIRDPRRLPVGRPLTIPRAWLRYTVEPAHLASYRGTIGIAVGGAAVAPVIGAAVGEGAEITTAANSFVTLILADRSKLVIPSQSRVAVRQLRRILLTGAMEYQVQVEGGRVETKVTPLSGAQDRYRIGTPISMTAVRGTEFRVSYDSSLAVAAAEVLAGKVAVSGARGGEEIANPGFGATTDAGGETRLTTLLPAPDLTNPGQVQTKDSVEFHVTAVPGAARYRVVLASDAGFVENIAEAIGQTRDFALSDVPNGNQFVRVSAISDGGVQGLAQTYTFTRRLASIHAEAGQVPDGFRFRWYGAGAGTRRYRFQLMRGSLDSRAIVDEVGLTRDEITLRNLAPDTYYWRVGLAQTDESGEAESWTDPEKLTIAKPDKKSRSK